jgi:CheY-like chemotaxis protein
MKQTVLMIDDDIDDVMLAKSTFEALKADVEFHYLLTPGDIIQFLNQNMNGHLPDLILLDLNMPTKDGKAVLQELKANDDYSGIPVVIFTTSRSEEEKANCFRLKANSFVSKPVSFNHWEPVMHSICALYIKNSLN